MSYLQTHCPETYAQGAMARYDAEYFAPKTDVFDRVKQDINDAEPSDYIDCIEIITDQDHHSLAVYASAKIAEEYGVGIRVEVHPSEIRGSLVIVHAKESDEFWWGKVDLAMKRREVLKFVEGII